MILVFHQNFTWTNNIENVRRWSFYNSIESTAQNRMSIRFISTLFLWFSSHWKFHMIKIERFFSSSSLHSDDLCFQSAIISESVIGFFFLLCCWFRLGTTLSLDLYRGLHINCKKHTNTNKWLNKCAQHITHLFQFSVLLRQTKCINVSMLLCQSIYTSSAHYLTNRNDSE